MSSTEDGAIVAATKVLRAGDDAITDFSDVVVPLTSSSGVAGWYADKALTDKVTSLSFSAERSKITYLYPKIEGGFWLTFDSNGGTYTSPKFCAGTASAPTEPTKYGYDFVGWYDKDLTTEADFSTITSACTLHAKWTARTDTKYTVVYWYENADDDGYSYHDSTTMTGTTGEQTAAAAAAAEPGFTAPENEDIEQQAIAGDGSTIVNVYYTRNVYEVRFYAGENEYDATEGTWGNNKKIGGVEKKISAKYGANIENEWKAATDKGCRVLDKTLRDADGEFLVFETYKDFQAHFYDIEGQFQANMMVMPLNGAELWLVGFGEQTQAEYYVENLDGSEYELHHTDEYSSSSAIITDADKYGITGFKYETFAPGEWTEFQKEYIVGQDLNGNGEAWDEDDQALWADWSQRKWDGSKFYYTRNTYDVVYMNHSQNPVHKASYKYEADISDAGEYTPERPYGIPENYVFDGWYKDEELTVPCDFGEQKMPANNITVYAKWIPPVCKVTFVAYDEVIKTVTDITYGNALGQEQIPTVTPQEGDEFYYWSYDEAGTQRFSSETKITEDITLYAQLGSTTGYTVIYDANGGSGTVTDSHHYAKGAQAMVLSADTLTAPENKQFIGWNTKADGSGEMYTPDSALPITGAITLYAIWGDAYGWLTVKKTVSGSASKTADYSFTVTLKDKADYSENGFANGVASFTLQADHSITLTVPAGTKYTVTETTTGYTVTVKVDGKEVTATDNSVSGNIAKNSAVFVTFDNYQRRYIPPTPTPTPDPAKKIIVTITGNTGSEVYDATEHNVKGYTWECTDPSYTEDDFEFTGTADAKGTYVGKYDMGIKPEQFKNLNSAYDVEFVVKTDGELDITKKPLTITAGSAEGYGPEAITCDTYTATELAKGDKLVSVKITGKQSVPGSSANVASDAVIQDANGKDVTANYEIKYVDGTLTMLEILNKEDHFNYVIGYPDDTVRPNANITRAEVATIFFRLLTDDGRKEFDTKTSTFSDVADGQWYTRAIATLANAKIVSGYPDGSFRPNDSITRAEMATIIARFANLSADGKTFSDIKDHWAQKYIELAAGNGWINGYSDGSFGPDKKITRAETFAMINRVLDRQTESNDDLLPASQMLNWSDNANTTEWYYRDMQEATNNHKCERIGDSEYEKWTEKLPEIDWASYQI